MLIAACGNYITKVLIIKIFGDSNNYRIFVSQKQKEMENIIYDTGAGDYLENVITKAIGLSFDNNNRIVEFEFNGVKVLVNINSPEELVERDYRMSLWMDWKTIGPHYPTEHPESILKVYEAKQLEYQIQEQKEQEEYARQTALKIKLVEELVVNQVIQLKDPEAWANVLEVNKDSSY